MIKASELRDQLGTVARDKAGYYIWWAKRHELDLLLAKLGTSFAQVAPHLYQKDDLFAIYTGVAIKRSLHDRLNWHLNDKHTLSKVRSGTLSTYRQSLSSLLAGTQRDQQATDDFIDKLYIEYHTSEHPINSAQAHNEIHRIENQLMADHLFIINIKDNHHPAIGNIKHTLSTQRKLAKTKAIAELSVG